MIITELGKDIVTIDEESVLWKLNRKIHIIKLNFRNPTNEKIDMILDTYPTTNRFVVSDYIRFYNFFFKKSNKKYYVENTDKSGIFSFFKKNNKVLLNFCILDESIKEFLFSPAVFSDILKNLEIIRIGSNDFEYQKSFLENWNGNVIVE